MHHDVLHVFYHANEEDYTETRERSCLPHAARRYACTTPALEVLL